MMTKPSWFTAVTSAPRRQPTIGSTITSLYAADFDPHVFAEPRPHPDLQGEKLHVAPKRLGVWHNWVRAARAAVDSDADYALICQDDINIHPETREVVERLMFLPSKEVISVYTPRGYDQCRPGMKDISSDKLWGVVGIAYRMVVLAAMLEHPLIESWRGVKPAADDADIVNSDVAIGQILLSMNKPVWYPTPSFGIHTARYSTIPSHGSNDVKRNRNARNPADFNECLWSQLYPGNEQ